MLNYLIKRLTLVVPTILVVLVLTFFLVRATGSPVEAKFGEKGGTAAQREAFVQAHGLDRPLVAQFIAYFGDLFRGDMGILYGDERPVAREIVRRLPNTLILAAAAMIVATIVGVASGVACAVWRNSIFDHVLRFITFCFISTPVFWFGIMLILVFAAVLGWLPPPGVTEAGWSYFILPVVTLGLRPASFIARVTRSGMLDELSKDYVRTARAKGLPARRVILKHVVRNIWIPLITVIGGDLGSLLGGTMITETVFAFNGVGRFAVEAVLNREYNAVMAVALLWAAVFVVVNLLIDVAYAFADPRVAFQGEPA
jgi:ABC-type dipeptide/oligopeptide/nickel transport system permease component